MIPVWDWSSGDEEDEDDEDEDEDGGDDGGRTVRISEKGTATLPDSTGEVNQDVEMDTEMEMDSGMLGLRRVSV